MRAIGAWIAVLALAAGANAARAQVPAPAASIDPARLEQRLGAVETLLEKSSGARQVEASGDAAARQQRERARETYRQAHAAFQAGQYARAAELLPEASAQMFEAVRLAAPEQVTGPKARTDYEARLESVNVLHAAMRRVAAEKADAAGVAAMSRDIDNLVREAQRLAGDGKFDAGRAALDRAYLIVRAAVSSLRGGETLVRTLNFASKEEEYRYEVDRNDTHQMLLRVLLKDKTQSAGQQTAVDRALQLRVQADAAAAGTDHAMAIRLLEDSTRELIRAIRGAGIFIPG